MSNLTHCTIVPVTVHDGTIVHVAREDTSGIIYVPTSEIATKIIHKELATLAKWLNRNSIHSLEATPNLLYQLKHLHVIHPNTNRVYFVSQDDLRIILRSYVHFWHFDHKIGTHTTNPRNPRPFPRNPCQIA